MSLDLDASVTERDVEAALHVAAGETLAVLGPNGSGKSTLLSVVAGLVRPDRGRVVLDGRELTVAGRDRSVHVPPHDRRTALLGQDPLLFPHLSALDNVAFGARSSGLGRREARAVAQAWLDRLGVGELAGRRPGRVSGGQAQRVAVARALAAEPRVLLLDEPMAALDVEVRDEVRADRARHLRDFGRPTVLVTHDAADVAAVADDVVVIQEGRVTQHGTPDDLRANPATPYVARLFGDRRETMSP